MLRSRQAPVSRGWLKRNPYSNIDRYATQSRIGSEIVSNYLRQPILCLIITTAPLRTTGDRLWILVLFPARVVLLPALRTLCSLHQILLPDFVHFTIFEKPVKVSSSCYAPCLPTDYLHTRFSSLRRNESSGARRIIHGEIQRRQLKHTNTEIEVLLHSTILGNKTQRPFLQSAPSAWGYLYTMSQTTDISSSCSAR